MIVLHVFGATLMRVEGLKARGEVTVDGDGSTLVSFETAQFKRGWPVALR